MRMKSAKQILVLLASLTLIGANLFATSFLFDKEEFARRRL